MIRHVVLMKFSDPADGCEAKRRLEEMWPQIPTVTAMEVGLDVLHGEASYDLVLVSEHPDMEGLQSYQSHPVHQEFLGWVRPRLTARATVDVEI